MLDVTGPPSEDERMDTFRATLWRADIDDPRYHDDYSTEMPTGPDGKPPTEVRTIEITQRRKYVDTYVLEEDMVFMPWEVHYRYDRTEIIELFGT